MAAARLPDVRRKAKVRARKQRRGAASRAARLINRCGAAGRTISEDFAAPFVTDFIDAAAARTIWTRAPRRAPETLRARP